jgi:hypothetical protein
MLYATEGNGGISRFTANESSVDYGLRLKAIIELPWITAVFYSIYRGCSGKDFLLEKALSCS